ncbi:MAG: hypothetical protein LC792_06580 [Actinobacteria bacterium]|nr:hypothetical protein [Actinomycetota bacterium]
MVGSGKRTGGLPAMVRGSLITLRRKCGKPGCRCVGGAAHETPALSVSVAGRSAIVTLRGEDVPAVRAALARYQAARDKLEAEATAGVEVLRERTRRGR